MAKQAGDLDQRVTLERNSPRRDGAGGATDIWSTYDTVWAEVRPLKGRERQSAQRTEATADYLVTVRNRTDVKEEHRLGWNGRKLNITFIRLDPRSQWLEIEATLGVGS